MYKGNYEVEVLVNGHPAREYPHRGKVYIEGRKETAYKIKVRNNGCSRIKAVISVDGLNILSGEKATLLGRGYIINGYDSLVVDGWRKSVDTVHEFYFSDCENSYSVRSGNGGVNIGVIGVSIVEEEKQNEWTYYWNGNSYDNKKSNPYFIGNSTYTISNCKQLNDDNTHYMMYCSANGSTDDVKSLGTGWGKEMRSDVINVSFNSKGYPAETFEIFYDTKNGLKKKGICFDHRPCYIDGGPSAFPGSFCTPPGK